MKTNTASQQPAVEIKTEKVEPRPHGDPRGSAARARPTRELTTRRPSTPSPRGGVGGRFAFEGL